MKTFVITESDLQELQRIANSLALASALPKPPSREMLASAADRLNDAVARAYESSGACFHDRGSHVVGPGGAMLCGECKQKI